MIKFTAFRTQKPRQFNYIPRHYDPEQERREERRRELLGDRAEPLPEGEYKPGQYLRRSIAVRRGTDRSLSKRHNPSRPLRIVVFMILLVLAAWWVLFKM